MRLTVHVSVLIGLATACTSSPPRLDWTIDFADGAPRPPEVTAVRAWIRDGDCVSGETVYSVVRTLSGPMVAEPPPLDDGVWAFGAEALDAECRTVATACEVIVVPTQTPVTLELEALDPPSAGCPASAVCEAGTCVGPFDAGALDAGPRDAATDAGIDAGIDAGPPDAGCASVETECRDGDDDDCDGAIDCADPDCAGQSCDGGTCGGGVCCTTCVSAAGACVASTSWTQCGRNGEACERCADCVGCRATGTCGATVSAGTPCTGGVCIGTTSLTCCTGCVQGTVSTGTCEAGSSTTACGSGGDACVACAAGEGCTSRNECCGGCTSPTGLCRVGTAKLNCGTGGAACESCTGLPNDCCDTPSGVGGMCVPEGCGT